MKWLRRFIKVSILLLLFFSELLIIPAYANFSHHQSNNISHLKHRYTKKRQHQPLHRSIRSRDKFKISSNKKTNKYRIIIPTKLREGFDSFNYGIERLVSFGELLELTNTLQENYRNKNESEGNAEQLIQEIENCITTGKNVIEIINQENELVISCS